MSFDRASASIQNVIFDLGGVLLTWKPDEILAEVFESCNLREVVKREVFRHPDWLALDRGDLDIEEAIRNFSHRTRCSITEIRRLMTIVGESLTPMPESFSLLEELLVHGFNLYCMSNMQMHYYHYLQQRYDFWHLFKGVVISAEVNMVKPEPEIFTFILEKYALMPGETVFIDDVEENIEQARKTGMRGIVFRNATQCREDLAAL